MLKSSNITCREQQIAKQVHSREDIGQVNLLEAGNSVFGFLAVFPGHARITMNKLIGFLVSLLARSRGQTSCIKISAHAQ